MYYLKEMLEKFFQETVNILYPRVCPFCGKIVDEEGICRECKRKLKYIKEPRCKKCSKPLKNQEGELCYDCRRYNHKFEYGYALWQMDDNLKKSIYKFKFGNQRYFAQVYGKEIVRVYGEKIRQINPEAIIPVPLHKSRERARGFNQSLELAKVIGRELDIPVLEKQVLRNRKTISQKNLNHKQRINNIKNAFILGKNSVKLKKVIIIDDVYTTGFTIDAVTSCLIGQEKGNMEDTKKCMVYFITIGIGEGL